MGEWMVLQMGKDLREIFHQPGRSAHHCHWRGSGPLAPEKCDRGELLVAVQR